MNHAPPTADNRMIAGVLPCIRCGYDLDKRSLDSLCPECGNAAALTLDSLWLDDPAYIERLRSGVKRMMWAAMIGPLVYIGGFAIAFLFRTFSGGGQTMAALAGAIVVVGPFVAWRGAAMVATPRRQRYSFKDSPVSSQGQVRAAWFMAGAFAMCFTCVVLLIALEALASRRINDRYSLALALAAGEFWSVRNILILGQIRVIAGSAGMPKLERLAPAMQWWAGANALGGGVVVAFAILLRTPGGFREATMFVYGSFIVWLIVWPILLARFSRGLGAITRQFAGLGQPIIVEPAAPSDDLTP